MKVNKYILLIIAIISFLNIQYSFSFEKSLSVLASSSESTFSSEKEVEIATLKNTEKSKEKMNLKIKNSSSLFRIDDSPVTNLHDKFNKYEHDHNSVEINDHFDVNDKLKVFKNRNKDHNEKLATNYNSSVPANYKTVIKSKKRIDDKITGKMNDNNSNSSTNIKDNDSKIDYSIYSQNTKTVLKPDENEYKVKLTKGKRHFTCNENQLGSCGNHCVQYLGIYSCMKEVIVIDEKSSEESNLPILCICRKHFMNFTISMDENTSNK